MNPLLPTGRPSWFSILLWVETLLGVGIFLGVAYQYSRVGENWFPTDRAYLGVMLSGLCFALVMRWIWDPGLRNVASGLFEGLSIGIGSNLLLQSLLMYAHVLEPTPWPILVAAGTVFTLAVLPLRLWSAKRQQREPGITIWVGAAFPPDTELAAGKIVAAAPRDLAAALQTAPARAVVLEELPTEEAQEQQVLRELLQAQAQGALLVSSDQFYEWKYARIPAESLRPADLRWFTTLTASRTLQALQAVYSNLVGLALLVGLSPVLIPLAVWSRLAAGPGTVLEQSWCSGFQGVPFRRFRYRTHRGLDGTFTGIGAWLYSWRLAELPQLINVVRGEMSLFGPAPVRVEAAERLRQMLPFSAHRFTVRPGLFGWAQLHERDGVQDEIQRLEFDLYYLKAGNVLFDLEILTHMLRGGAR